MKDSKKTNIILIGMPGSGKTTVGRILAQKLRRQHSDGDSIIMEQEGSTLQEILNSKGQDYFISLESKVLSGLDCENRVISPGGSVCYYPEAMVHLALIGHVVYLNVEFEEIERRVKNLESRGIVFKPGQSFEDLFSERAPLYEKYAELNIKTKGQSPEETADIILSMLGMVP